jgi:sugar transferase (PEP-CTERM/EpsH1 system associated)
VRVLWVKAGGLVPPDVGGKIRSYHILKELAKRHEVTFFTFYAAHANDFHAELERVFNRSLCVPLQIPEAGSRGDYLNFARALFSPLPYSVWKYCRPGVSAKLHQIAKSGSFDIVVCDFLLPAAILPWDLPCPKIIFTHNVEALIWRRHYEVAASPAWKLVCGREYRRMAKFERQQLIRADHVLTVSATDRDFFAQFMPVAKIDVIPTGVDVEFFHPAAQAAADNMELVFTGSMDWLPNEDGIFYFVDEILPLILKQAPGVTLTIVGRKPSARLQDLPTRHANIRVTGRVDDIRPYVSAAAVYIVPLRVGSGTRLKIFEAMSMGKAIVSTTVGAEGLPVSHGKDILLEDSPSDFAAAVLRLLSDRGARELMGNAARRLVEHRYSWASVAAEFERILRWATLEGPWPVHGSSGSATPR